MSNSRFFPLPSRGSISVRSDGNFTAYWLDADKVRVRIAGPEAASARFFKGRIPEIAAYLEISCAEKTMCSVDFNDYGTKEEVDPVPAAIPLDAKQPVSLEQLLQRIVRTELSRNAEKIEAESFEEADDFDLPGMEWDDFESRYVVMEDEEAPSPEAPAAGGAEIKSAAADDTADEEPKEPAPAE